MLIALEGSSPTIYGENNRKYYVWQAYQETNHASLYVPGPAAVSWGPSPINIRKMADKATRFIKQNTGNVYLIGWSRGAAACIQVAHDLKRSGNVRIDGMFLFDAVDMDGSTSSDLNFIPDNVYVAYHAIATDKSWFDGQIFPTCGKTAGKGVHLYPREFHTTHGGIAGADKGDAGSKEWMWTNMRNHGVV